MRFPLLHDLFYFLTLAISFGSGCYLTWKVVKSDGTGNGTSV